MDGTSAGGRTRARSAVPVWSAGFSQTPGKSLGRTPSHLVDTDRTRLSKEGTGLPEGPSNRKDLDRAPDG